MPSNSWLAAFLSFCFCVEKAQATSELIPLIPPLQFRFFQLQTPSPPGFAPKFSSAFLFSLSLIHLFLVLDTD